jgi:hypothetical protein
MKFKPFDEQERDLLLKMHNSGLKGDELYQRFDGNPVYENIVGLRGKKAIQNAITNIRNGRVDYTKPWGKVPAASESVVIDEPKKRGRPPGKKDKKPRRTIVRASKGKGLHALKVYKKTYRKWAKTVPASTDPVPAQEPRFKFNNCPACGCPLHGAQEGLRTEQELRGDA